MKKLILNSKKGILFWITGLSRSGKTSIAKKIKKRLSRLYGPTLEMSGDEFRTIFKSDDGYTNKARKKNIMKNLIFAKLITDQKINLIFNLIGMYDYARNWNRKNIDNYVEIYIEANIHKIMKLKHKRTYLKYKHKRDIVGWDIKAELPKKPHIIIKNNFHRTITDLSNETIDKIKKLI
jgi:adenylylsulfate kinase|tara:strand:+ start:1077 stop:1613 length:537 start_codon:yes stop_codon:yes gene_type:complete